MMQCSLPRLIQTRMIPFSVLFMNPLDPCPLVNPLCAIRE
jgi:hypothetical protein